MSDPENNYLNVVLISVEADGSYRLLNEDGSFLAGGIQDVDRAIRMATLQELHLLRIAYEIAHGMA